MIVTVAVISAVTLLIVGKVWDRTSNHSGYLSTINQKGQIDGLIHRGHSGTVSGEDQLRETET